MTLQEKETQFLNEVMTFTNFNPHLLAEFFDYWSEPNKKGKMKFELEKTWDTKRRLFRWQNNKTKWNESTTKTGTSVARIEALRNW